MEIQSIIWSLEDTLDGEPWYGRPVYALLRDVDPAFAFTKPSADSHSLMELLYHLLTWAEFTLARLEKDSVKDLKAFEEMDWRNIDPNVHDWDEGLANFIATNQQIIAILKTKDDLLLKEKVDYRNYDFRFLLNGYIQHNIYHAAQIAYLNKMLN